MEKEKISYKQFFNNYNTVMIIPLLQAGADCALLANFNKLFGLLGLAHFTVMVSMERAGGESISSTLLFATDMHRQYHISFMRNLLHLILDYTETKIAFMRWYEHVKINWLESVDTLFTFAYRAEPAGNRSELLGKGPSAPKKLHPLLEMLNKNSFIHLYADPQYQATEIIPEEAPGIETWSWLYQNASGLVQNCLAKGITGQPPQADPQNRDGSWREAKLIYAMAKKDVADCNAVNLYQQILRDARLSINYDLNLHQLDIFGNRAGEGGNDDFYWQLLSRCHKVLGMDYVAISRGEEVVPPISHDLQFEPLTGLNGSAHFQIITNALQKRGVDFAEYLKMVGIFPNLLDGKCDITKDHIPELWQEAEFLRVCLPMRNDGQQKFPIESLKILCVDCPSVDALKNGESYRIYFPHYFNKPAISQDQFLNLMALFALLLNLNFLLVQNSMGEIFRINLDHSSTDFGAYKKIGCATPTDTNEWQGLLQKETGASWNFQYGTAKGEELPFVCRPFFNPLPERERSKARKHFITGPALLKKTYNLLGDFHNFIIHPQNDPASPLYHKLLTNPAQFDPEDMFTYQYPLFFVELSGMEDGQKEELAKALAWRGSLVLHCESLKRQFLLVRPCDPAIQADKFWHTLKEGTDQFVGISLGHPWYVPEGKINLLSYVVPSSSGCILPAQ